MNTRKNQKNKTNTYKHPERIWRPHFHPHNFHPNRTSSRAPPPSARTPRCFRIPGRSRAPPPWTKEGRESTWIHHALVPFFFECFFFFFAFFATCSFCFAIFSWIGDLCWSFICKTSQFRTPSFYCEILVSRTRKEDGSRIPFPGRFRFQLSISSPGADDPGDAGNESAVIEGELLQRPLIWGLGSCTSAAVAELSIIFIYIQGILRSSNLVIA